MNINRLLIDVQESSPKAFKIANTPELPGALSPGPSPGHCPWTPPEALRCARLVSFQQHQLFLDEHSFQNDGQLQNPSEGLKLSVPMPDFSNFSKHVTQTTTACCHLSLTLISKCPWCEQQQFLTTRWYFAV